MRSLLKGSSVRGHAKNMKLVAMAAVLTVLLAPFTASVASAATSNDEANLVSAGGDHSCAVVDEGVECWVNTYL